MQIFPIADAFRLAQSAAPVAITALWQGAAVAAALSICLRLAPRVSAAHRFTAWGAGFAVVAGLPMLPLMVHRAGELGSDAGSALARPITHPWLMLDIRWSLVIAVLWAVASAVRAAGLAFHSLRLRALWKSATPIEDELAESLRRQCDAGGVAICTTGQLDRPSVIGFFAPRILIPDWLFAGLTREELEQVVLHEAEHLRRHDDWTNLLQKLCLVMFPLNPALAFIERKLCREREMACDEAVVRRTRAPRAYAACLASLAERGLARRLGRRAEALSLGAWQHRPELVDRVHSILRGVRTLNPIAGRALLAALSCGLIFGSVELARCPQVVAFLPAQTAFAVAQANPDRPARLIPASFVPRRESRFERSAQPFRAVNVNAIMPATRPAMAMNPRPAVVAGSQPPRAWQAKSPDLVAAAPREQLLKAEMPQAQPNSAAQPQQADQPQQWVVLTTWEQVQTSPASGEIADYDSGSEADASEPTQAGSAAGRMTITRMILRVYPANAPAGSGQAAQ